MKKYAKWIAVCSLGACLAVIPLGFFSHKSQSPCNSMMAAADAENPAISLYHLTWPMNPDAVGYELEITWDPFSEPFQDAADPLYSDAYIYMNQTMLDVKKLPRHAMDGTLYFRVRPYNLDREPIGPWSGPMAVREHGERVSRMAPLTRGEPANRNAASLLYPVYAYTTVPGAVKYEIEVLSAYPENPDGTAPSRYRIFSTVTELTDFYDPKPRIGIYYWRVRGLDGEGNPVGIWSLPARHELSSKGWTVGVYGDSISHGGGHMSYSPDDWLYSYESYIDFPVVNLSDSGDTSEMMVRRFEQDVLPFHLKYLLILGGTNSLRGGASPESVISDLKTIQQKCRIHGIVPVLMTLPPINPENIRHTFQEETVPGWRGAFDEVNDFIRTQPHIDTARPFASTPVMPTRYALDGLHGDIIAKQMMAGEINQAMKEHNFGTPEGKNQEEEGK